MAKGLAEVLRFGRYEPLFRIGIGGMAEVYAARITGEAGFQKLVAVKRMLPHLSGDQKFVDMFLDEARLAANITSPHVVQTLDLGRAEDDSLYIVMELVVGITLTDTMKYQRDQGEPIDPSVALELIAQSAQGLDDAHEARAPDGSPLSLVHRDVSPQNILIGLDGRARMSDFGVAHAMHLRRTHTQVGEKKGKFSYFSPEQSHGEPLDRRSDVFSLGIVAWELLVGRRLFRGQPEESLVAVREKPIPAPLELRRDLPGEVSDAIMRALQRDIEGRYATGAQMAASLRRAALILGEPTTPRAIGHYVQTVGGDELRRMRERIAGGVPGGVDAPTGTAILPIEEGGAGTVTGPGLQSAHRSGTGGAAGTAVLGSVDLLEVPTLDPEHDTVEQAAAPTVIRKPLPREPAPEPALQPAPEDEAPTVEETVTVKTPAEPSRPAPERGPVAADPVEPVVDVMDAAHAVDAAEAADAADAPSAGDLEPTRVYAEPFPETRVGPTPPLGQPAIAPAHWAPAVWWALGVAALGMLVVGGGVAAWVTSSKAGEAPSQIEIVPNGPTGGPELPTASPPPELPGSVESAEVEDGQADPGSGEEDGAGETAEATEPGDATGSGGADPEPDAAEAAEDQARAEAEAEAAEARARAAGTEAERRRQRTRAAWHRARARAAAARRASRQAADREGAPARTGGRTSSDDAPADPPRQPTKRPSGSGSGSPLPGLDAFDRAVQR